MRYLITFIALYTCFTMFSQSPQIFHEPFRTSSDIYGYTTTKTKPTGFGTLAIEQLATIIEGVNGYSGSDLQEFGITFPMRCTNCYYYVSGEVSMKIPDNDFRSRANFSQGGSVNLNSGLNRSISWNDLTIKRHNEALTKYRQGNYWENTGRVESIKISEVKGADFGLITRAIEKFEKKKLNRSNYLYYLKKANYSGNPSYQERLSFALEARTFAQSDNEINEIDSLINKLQEKISLGEEISNEEIEKTNNSENIVGNKKNSKSKTSNKKEQSNYTKTIERNSKIIDEMKKAEREGDYRKASRIQKNNPHLFSAEEKANTSRNALIQSGVELISMIPAADEGYINFNYFKGDLDYVGINYTFLWANGEMGVGLTIGGGISVNAKKTLEGIEVEEDFDRGLLDSGNGYLASAGIAMGNPGNFALFNGFAFQLYYENIFSIPFYDPGMSQENGFNTVNAKRQSFGLGMDIVILKYLRVGGVYLTHGDFVDSDGDTNYWNSTIGEYIEFADDPRFQNNFSLFAGIVFPF